MTGSGSPKKPLSRPMSPSLSTIVAQNPARSIQQSLISGDALITASTTDIPSLNPSTPGTSSSSSSDQRLSDTLKSFTFTPANDYRRALNGEKILESISSSTSVDTFAGEPLTMRARPDATKKNRRLSIGNHSVIPTLLNAQLNNINLFDFDNDEDDAQAPVIGQDKPKVCLEHKLSTLSTALMTKKQLGKIITGIRDIERTLNHINIKANINNIMIITKLHDIEPIQWAQKVIDFLLTSNDHIQLYIQEELWTNPYFAKSLDLEHCNEKQRIHFWRGDRCSFKPETIDLLITFGGDGTVLYGSWMFQKVIPPVLAFSLGSLGFLTEFDVQDYENILTNILENGYQCSIRMRFECTIMKAKNINREDANLKNEIKRLGKPDSDTHEILESYTVFNEVVIDRGPNSTMTSIELFGDYDSLTTAEADGLIISTPSGSTAYSLSAGGSLVHPEIPGILISPICPHTLSFRPLIIPESIILRLGVPYDSRSTAWCSFDGKNRVELNKGDFLTVTASRYPLPCIRQSSSKNAWFERLSETLHWNERKPQKPFIQTDQFSY
ncbi:hypothetical protein WICPIJ_007261 [Wickerhamomyces pijperi]|uniref:NAD(+) kinase n=1 Tax=Wickerhamomyces pijperi TaxID=599730 RepID=A0A9P8Q0K5_WICPI|nr:hypothetical protein WICPIJ_007261 [Wickerhamomyces pijperi]